MKMSESDTQNEIDLSDVLSGDQRTQLRWLVKRIDLLSKAIGIDIECCRPAEIETLYWYYLDVRAKDVGRGVIAIPTSATGASGHWTLGALVTAASEFDPRFLVLAAPNFHHAHMEALKWLDRVTVKEVRVYGVQIRSEFRLVTA